MPPGPRAAARDIADRLLRIAVLQRAALRTAAARRRAAVLLWHRVAPDGPQEHEVVPTVPLAQFCSQLDLLQELGTVVPLAAIDDGSEVVDGRPLFALTFDDDDARHARYVLPALVERSLPATFFLSGRWLHGHGPYWWELLEMEVMEVGTAVVAARYGMPPDTTTPAVGRALIGTPAAQSLAARAQQIAGPPMVADDAVALVAAAMEVGFHTIDHDVLPNLQGPALDDAVSVGRDRLSQAIGTTIERFAYPHGRTDDRTTASADRAGYRSAWTTAKRTARAGDAPMLRGRWDVSHRSVDDMRQILVRGLARPTP